MPNVGYQASTWRSGASREWQVPCPSCNAPSRVNMADKRLFTAIIVIIIIGLVMLFINDSSRSLVCATVADFCQTPTPTNQSVI